MKKLFQREWMAFEKSWKKKIFHDLGLKPPRFRKFIRKYRLAEIVHYYGEYRFLSALNDDLCIILTI
jgi:hypothetical protein